MKPAWIFILISIAVMSTSGVYGDEVYLKNGDHLTGKILEETEDSVLLETEAMGELSIKKASVERVKRGDRAVVESGPEVKKPDDIIWDRNFSMGYNRTSGNTDASQLNLDLSVNRKRQFIDELTLRGNIYCSSSNKEMNSQKWFTSARYAFSFGEKKDWYNFYKLEVDHDRFANVDYRTLPSAGIGYWFYDRPDIKAMTEAAIGFEYTDYRDSQEDDDEVVLIPRAYLEKNLYGDSRISQDLVLYSTPGDLDEYRLKSETTFTSPVSEEISLKLSVIDDYDSEPAGGAKKNDFRFISSLIYSF